MEHVSAKDSGAAVVARNRGRVERVSAKYSIREIEEVDGKRSRRRRDRYNLTKV
jgi:DNA-directed RNA polymerase subunit beta